MNLKLIEKLNNTFQDEKGEYYTKSIGKQIITNMSIDVYDIKSVKEILSNKGTILKTQCLIHHTQLGTLLVKENFNKLNKRIHLEKKDNIIIVKGFQQNGNK